MLTVWIIAYTILLLYAGIIIAFAIGWKHIKIFNNTSVNPGFKISVIIPYRNECLQMENLINDLKSQDLDKSAFEVLFVNDHSEDNSLEIVKWHIENEDNFQSLELDKNTGKKYAVNMGVHNANGKLIVTTDADCRVGESWLSAIAAYYEQTGHKLISGPVQLTGRSFFEKMQIFEFISLITSGAGAIGLKNPIMCNGANLIFEKNLYMEFQDDLRFDIPSGDDIFLLLNAKKKYRNQIGFLKSENAIVRTPAKINLDSFIQQRIRWASKAKSYADPVSITVSVFVLLANIIAFLSIHNMFLFERLAAPFFGLITLKLGADMILLSSVKFYKRGNLFWAVFPLQVFYPMYIVYTGILGLFSGYKWKNRSY